MDNSVAPPWAEQPGTQPPSELTWSALLDKFVEVLKKEGKEKQEGNFKTACKFFLTSIGLAETSPVGGEFGDEFEAKIRVFTDFEAERGLTGSTYGPRVSKIRELKRFAEVNFAESLRFQTLPQTFGRKLLKLITSSGHTVRSFWRTLPGGVVSYKALVSWSNERAYPSIKKHVAAVKTIETLLRVPAGTLRLSKYLCVEHHLKAGQSDYGNKIRAAQAKPYGVWTPTLEEEFQKLFTHKTEAVLPEGEERHDSGQWTTSEGGGVPSADAVRDVLRSFMGFCALPEGNPDPYLRGRGIKLEGLSLALLADKELVEAHLKFMKLRSGLRVRKLDQSKAPTLSPYLISANGKWEFYDKGGKYNHGSIDMLSSISSLLRTSTGYLYQHPEFAEKLGLRMTAATWHKQCAATRSRVVKVLREITLMKKKNDQKNFDFGRDPKERIGWILELKRPLSLLQGMLKEMQVDLLPECATELAKAKQYGDLLLFAFLCANPLRIRMFSIMEFEENLVRMNDGSWRLRFKRGAFKNRKSLSCDYDVRVAKELWPMLDRYREEFYPILAGSSGARHVFIACKKRQNGISKGAPLKGGALRYIIERLTEQYAPSGTGFGPHAFRHIIATDIIKKDPRIGFFLAAIALHDKLETVEREYVHLKTSEFFEPVNTHFGESWNLVFNLSQAEPVADTLRTRSQ